MTSLQKYIQSSFSCSLHHQLIILSLVFGNEEKLVALLVYSSVVRVATSRFRIIPYSLVVVVVCAQMRSESGITPYSPQH